MKALFTQLRDYVSAWADSLIIQRGLAPLTAEAYRQDMETFFIFQQELEADNCDLPVFTGPFEEESQFLLYLSWLRGRGNSARTVARRISALRSFFEYAQSEGGVFNNHYIYLENPKLPLYLP